MHSRALEILHSYLLHNAQQRFLHRAPPAPPLFSLHRESSCLARCAYKRILIWHMYYVLLIGERVNHVLYDII